jgi:lantibiotic modifying enzyme
VTASTVAFAPDAGLRDRARWTAIELGERLLYESEAGLPDPFGQWVPSRSLNGSSGFALAFLALAQATGDSRFEAAMHGHLRKAALLEDRPGIGLVGGISGLRAAAAVAMAVEPRYRRLVEQCDAFVDEQLPQAPHASQTFCDFDVISGWSGVRLARCVDAPRERDRSIELLAWTIGEDERWRCAHPHTGTVENDMGLAHGMPGMLAALALTLDEPGATLRDSMRRCAWNVASEAIDMGGMLAWPVSPQAGPRERYRMAWCYGTPGVAASLHAVARYLHDAELEAFAIGALEGLASRPCSEWIDGDEAICHGTAGNALIFASVGTAGGVPSFLSAAERLVAETIDRLEANGGQCLVWSDEDGNRHANVGELTGTAGIVLTLLTLAGDAEASWMRCHGLQPLR